MIWGGGGAGDPGTQASGNKLGIQGAARQKLWGGPGNQASRMGEGEVRHTGDQGVSWGPRYPEKRSGPRWRGGERYRNRGPRCPGQREWRAKIRAPGVPDVKGGG